MLDFIDKPINLQKLKSRIEYWAQIITKYQQQHVKQTKRQQQYEQTTHVLSRAKTI
jgi:FixJ family two-component response regulator